MILFDPIRGSFLGTKLGLFRAYALLIGGIVIALYVLREDNAYDPFWLRIVVGGFSLSAFGLSFVGPFFRRHIDAAVQISNFLTLVWLALLMRTNNFADVMVNAYSLMTFSALLLYADGRRLFLYSVGNMVLLVAISVGAENPEYDIATALILNVAVLVAINLAVQFQQFGRRKLEKGLDQSTTIQNVALESSRDAILLVDEGGNLQKANASFCELWEVPGRWVKDNRQQEILRHCMDRVHDPESFAGHVGGLGTPLEEGVAIEISMRDGRQLEMYWIPLQVGTAEIGRLWFFGDITDRIRLKNQLIASERRLRRNNERLMEFARSTALVTGDLDAAFSEIAQASAEMLTVDTVSIWTFSDDRKSMVCRKLYRRSTDAYEAGVQVPLSEHRQYIEELERSRALVVSDTRRNPATEAFYAGSYTGRATALIHAQIRSAGQMVGIISLETAAGPRIWTVEDQSYVYSMADLVTASIEGNARHRAQLQLQNSVAILQAIFDLSETGIIVEDNEHNVLEYNELYLETWHMTREFIENAPYEEQIAWCKSLTVDSNRYAVGLERIKKRPDMEYAGIIEFKDGRIVERYSKAVSLGGKIRGRVWFYLDITERKQKETELINRNFELDSFVYRASHDLKAPLNSIMGLIDIIRGEKDVQRILSYVAMMDKSVKKLDEFIKQLTQFSQDARLKVVRKPVQIREFVQEIVGDLSFMDQAARVDIQLDIQQVGEFQTDPVRLAIVFNNIISNAIKYQDAKKPNPYLKVQISANEHAAECRFEDNGLGIDNEHLEKVFDLFFRASVQATGSGLGLYITHNAVEKMGGTIEVKSEPGIGTLFAIHIPNRLLEGDAVV
ncbi:MAG: ATP-binding protein [Bacteroidota bacterium]